MKTKKLISLILTLLLIMSMLTACGGSSKSESAAYESPAAAPQEEMAYDSASGNSLTGGGENGSSALPENRKWIITIHMDAETEDLDGLLAALDENIKALNGFAEDQHIYNGSNYSSRRYRSASLTIRIPAGDVDKFTQEVAGIANVVSSEKNLEDITLNYVSAESRKAALEAEEKRLLELMEKAETMADLLVIEERLTDVLYELENTASRLRTYDNKIDYATIYLSINEVQEYTPVEDPTTWERIRDGFARSVKGLGEGLVDLFVLLIVASPYLVVYGGIAFVVLLFVKRRRKPKEKKEVKPWYYPKKNENPPEQK